MTCCVIQSAKRNAYLVNVNSQVKTQCERNIIAYHMSELQFILYMLAMLFCGRDNNEKRDTQDSDASCCCIVGFFYVCPHRRAGACSTNSHSLPIHDVGICMFAAV